MARQRKPAVSKTVGSVLVGRDASATGYRALVPIRCDTCGATIQAGESFTRPMMIGGGSRRYPACKACRPFQERG